MSEEDLELLITVVVGADDEQQARAACAGLLGRVDGYVVRASDCSDEEPGCWSVTISALSPEQSTHNVAGALARAVRGFVRLLGDEFPIPRVACEPPTAWTVLDDPDPLDAVVPGAERLLVEVWAGGDPDRRVEGPKSEVKPEQAPTTSGIRLLLRVDVATDRPAGAEWQARAVASRISGGASITRVTPHGRLLSVHFDLGSTVDSPTMALRDAMSSIGRAGWSAVERSGDTVTTRWSAAPEPESGITALELTATAVPAPVWTVPE